MRTESMGRGRACGTHRGTVYVVSATLTVALLVLGLAGCGQRSAAADASARASATATPAPPPQLAFRPVTLPLSVDPGSESVAVSPVDGTAAWACARAGSGPFQVWVTADEGATWHAAGTLHPTTPQQTGNCGMRADQRDTQAAVFTLTWGGGEAGDLASMSFYTHDGGQHWQQLPGWTAATAIDTDGATTYAILTITTPPPPPSAAAQTQPTLLKHVLPPRSRLSAPGPGAGAGYQTRIAFVMSRDGLQTWRELHPGGQTPQASVFQFWRGSSGASSGDLFAATYNRVLWHSADGGGTWTQVQTPDIQVTLGRWLAGRQTWMFCGPQGQAASVCSLDTGATWSPNPPLISTIHVSCDAWCHQKGGQDTRTSACSRFALASDGSLLAACQLESTESAPPQFMAYRLAPGGLAWAKLGVVPAEFCSVSADDILWCQTASDGQWQTASLPI